MTRMPPKNVVESDTYVETKAEIIKNLSITGNQFDELQWTFDLVLGTSPRIFPIAVPNLKVRIFTTRSGLLPAMKVWYVEEDDKILLLYIKLATDKDEHASDDEEQ